MRDLINIVSKPDAETIWANMSKLARLGIVDSLEITHDDPQSRTKACIEYIRDNITDYE